MKSRFYFAVLSGLAWCLLPTGLSAAEMTNTKPETPLPFINTSFENASPLDWEPLPDGSLLVRLFYDHERNSPNRAAGHWFFQVQAPTGTEVALVLTNFDNIWNGKKGSPVSTNTHCYVSVDGRKWDIINAAKNTNNTLNVQLTMPAPALYIARLEPYRISDLERLKAEIKSNPLVQIEVIGKTVEARELEIIRVGNPAAPHRILLRARAHAWEPGGNWVVQGMIHHLLANNAETESYRNRFCLYVMPMANKDGVARGWTRFNQQGKDLNRNWDQAPDAQFAPENVALEDWLKRMTARSQAPHLMIDLHNDNSGRLHLSRPEMAVEQYLARMQRLEALLRQHTWFTEGSTGSSFRNPGSIGEGLLQRFGMDAVVLELNCDWIAGLKKPPFGADWELLGRQLCKVFADLWENVPLQSGKN
jgi:hypothetical protein